MDPPQPASTEGSLRDRIWIRRRDNVAAFATVLGAIAATATFLVHYDKHSPRNVSRTAAIGGLCDVTQRNSINASTHATIQFTNAAAQPVSVYWLNYKGDRQFYFELQSGDSYTQKTYLTHAWLITDAAGKCVGYTIADRATKDYTIGP